MNPMTFLGLVVALHLALATLAASRHLLVPDDESTAPIETLAEAPRTAALAVSAEPAR